MAAAGAHDISHEESAHRETRAVRRRRARRQRNQKGDAYTRKRWNTESRFPSSISTRDVSHSTETHTVVWRLKKKRDGREEKKEDDGDTPNFLSGTPPCVQSTPLFQLCKTNTMLSGRESSVGRMAVMVPPPKRMLEFRIGFFDFPYSPFPLSPIIIDHLPHRVPSLSLPPKIRRIIIYTHPVAAVSRLLSYKFSHGCEEEGGRHPPSYTGPTSVLYYIKRSKSYQKEKTTVSAASKERVAKLPRGRKKTVGGKILTFYIYIIYKIITRIRKK